MGKFDFSQAKDPASSVKGKAEQGVTGTTSEQDVKITPEILWQAEGDMPKWKHLLGTLELPGKLKVNGQSKKKLYIFVDNIGLTRAERVSPEFGYGAKPPPTTDVAAGLAALATWSGTLPVVHADGAGPGALGELFAAMGIADTFRHYAGKYWVYSLFGKETGVVGGVDDLDYTIKFLNPNLGSQPVGDIYSPFGEIKMVGTTPVQIADTSSILFNGLREKIEVHSSVAIHPSVGWDEMYWASFINGTHEGVNMKQDASWAHCIKLDESYMDCPFEIPTPFHENEIFNIEARKNSYMKLEPVYNYYIPGYEDMVSDKPWLRESVFPNIQVVSAMHTGITQAMQDSSHLSLVLLAPAGLFLSQKGKALDPAKISHDYFTKFAKTMNKLTAALKDAHGTKEGVGLTPHQQGILDTVIALEKEYSNIVIPYSDYELLKTAEDKKRFFPMYFNLEFTTDLTTELTDSLKATPFGMQLMIRVVKDIIEHGDEALGVFTGMPLGEFSEITFFKTQDAGDPTYEKRVAGEAKFIRNWDLESWLTKSGVMHWNYNKIDSNLMKKINQYFSDFAFLSKGYSKSDFKSELDSATDGALTGATTTAGSFAYVIQSLLFLNDFKKFVHNKFRSFEQVLSGKMAYSETILYRIKKTPLGKNGETRQEEHVQNIWIPNTNQLEVVKYLDSQVKYGVEYEYEIFAYQVVIGSRYKYESTPSTADKTHDQQPYDIAGNAIAEGAFSSHPGPEQMSYQGDLDKKDKTNSESSKDIASTLVKEISPNTKGECYTGKFPSGHFVALFDVVSEPMVKLVEVSYGKMTGKILDHAPIAPEVDLIPYHGVNNRLLININGGIGEYKAKPIFIEIEDSDKLQERVDPYTGLVHYKSDDSASNSGYFEVYRTDTMPFSYDDFRGKRHAIADPESLLEIQKGAASAAAFLDMTIKPNKTYWYTFRTIDVHGNLSNPSAVYQIELVDDKVSIYLINKVFEFPPRVKNIKSVPMKKYFQIEPAYLQAVLQKNFSSPLVDEEVENLLSEAKLGTRDQPLWGKKFKIRFTSRQTGRKIDLNIDFKTKRYNQAGTFIKGTESLTDPN